ncbi:MAG: transcription elongation factor Spt5 [Candidatus Marsarchaeota archaeon]|nr:transcription elongation factor Spt5 [Candidatus Marsarchaeota archaeon]
MFFVVKVTIGQESIISNILQNKAAKSDLPIYSILVVDGLKGYIIVEAEDEVACRQFVTKTNNIKGVLNKPLSTEELSKMIVSKSYNQEVGVGDIVEFTSGPFRGYKAKVLKVDDSKNDITVELMDVVVPIPVTAKINTTKIISKVEKS